jgi:hypothetical protein
MSTHEEKLKEAAEQYGREVQEDVNFDDAKMAYLAGAAKERKLREAELTAERARAVKLIYTLESLSWFFGDESQYADWKVFAEKALAEYRKGNEGKS